jgi:hypothetical protein
VYSNQNKKNIFLKIKIKFSLNKKYFPLSNFSIVKQIRESLGNSFEKIIFHETNAPLI